MPNYEKICWYCKSKNMEPVETWWRCRDCGATHVDLPKPSSYSITEVDNETGGSPRPGYPSHYKPSGQVQRSVAKAREASQAKE